MGKTSLGNKVLSTALSLSLVVSLDVPFTAFADEADSVSGANTLATSSNDSSGGG